MSEINQAADTEALENNQKKGKGKKNDNMA